MPKILLVDDDNATCSSLLNAINIAEDIEVLTVRSPAQAMLAVQGVDFGLVLVAFHPDRLDTVKRIRSCPRSATTPLVLMSSEEIDDAQRLAGYRSGAVDVLCAPFQKEMAHAKLSALLALGRRQVRTERHAVMLERENEELQAQRLRDLAAMAERRQVEEALRQSQVELRQLASYQDRIKEDERKRIAREIHDELGQNLLALRIDVSMLHARTGDKHPKLNQKVRAVLDHIDTTMKSMRAIINNLRPAVLDLGLNAAIEWQVKEFQRRSGVQCQLLMSEKELVLDDTRATALFRILQESLSNVLRHAQATKAEVELKQEETVVSMRIADNGIGIFPGCRRKGNSFGLIGIKERVSALGGKLTIKTGTDWGTTVAVSMPVEGDVPEPKIDAELPVDFRHDAVEIFVQSVAGLRLAGK